MNETRIALVDLWRPWNWPARLVFASFAVTQLLMAGTAIALTGVLWPVLSAYLLFVLGLVLLSLRWGHELPWWVTALVVVLMVGIALIESQFGFSSGQRFTDWYLGAAVVVMMAMMMWGRTAIGWLSFALFSAVQIAAAGFAASGPTLLRHAGTLVVATFVAVSMSRVAQQLTEAAAKRVQREANMMVRAAVAREREEQFERLDAIAGAVLRRITRGTPLDEAERAECLLVEATLRDTMSGRGFASADVLAVARSARERGVRVVLLDDSHGENQHIGLATEALVPVLEGLNSGSCTARILPAGRSTVASILVERVDGEGEVIEVLAPAPSAVDSEQTNIG